MLRTAFTEAAGYLDRREGRSATALNVDAATAAGNSGVTVSQPMLEVLADRIGAAWETARISTSTDQTRPDPTVPATLS